MMMIGSSVDYVRSGGMRNVPVTKAVEHLYATTVKFSGCVILASCPAYSYPPRRDIAVVVWLLGSITDDGSYHCERGGVAACAAHIGAYNAGATVPDSCRCDWSFNVDQDAKSGPGFSL
ncbi:hypothetical protein AVEN_164285-1 [Araneus ventricosus]|uniref:Uncharacterized protein n=1 Tax=Araneus ventricosus TaxID=182803 RepID=A0A4Y2GYY1_ARAVE|nr:hypothetical protein AVEN_164285-1 [Araneus ventricosus]